jgi:hypothetical protein
VSVPATPPAPYLFCLQILFLLFTERQREAFDVVTSFIHQ